jgi:GT2 family glycosyltransferase
MPERIAQRERQKPHRELIHLLNQRYHAEWERAERLQAELDGLKRSVPGRLLVWLRSWKRRLRPSAMPRITERAVPYTLLTGVPLPSGRVSIVIPFRDRPELMRNCLRSLRTSTYRDYEVVLVDNGSTEARTLRLLARLRRSSRYRVIDSPGEFNFARLCNTGAAAASGEHLLFLNNDTEVLARDWLERLLSIGADRTVGVVGATLLYPDRTIQHVGIFPRGDGRWVHPYRGLPHDHPGDDGELRIARCVPAVTAACLLVRRSLFAELGGFDERFPVAYNDVDLCLRVRQRGLSVVVTPEARLFHYESLSRGFSLDHPANCVT